MNWFVELMIALACAFYIYPAFTHLNKDATDLEETRSGLLLYTDYGTGCQYLATTAGSLTPRLDKDGNIVCIKTNPEDTQ